MEIRHRAVAIALLVTFGAPVPGKADKIDDYIDAHFSKHSNRQNILEMVRRSWRAQLVCFL
jgi:hypothetical protein